MTFADNLADELCNVTYDDLAAGTVEHVKMAIASTMAACAIGQQSPPVAIVRDLIRRRGAVPEALVWFASSDRAPAPDAARLNHMAADESMADDSALLNGSHLGSAVTACTLAVAETVGASGREIVTAIATGYEAAIRVGRAEARLRPTRNAHVSGLNAFGGAVAATMLLGPDRTAMAHALVLAATGTSGVDRVSTNNARAYQAGFSAGVGVESALAAHDGYRAETSVMDRYLDLIRFDGTPTGTTTTAASGAADGRWAIDTELIIKLRPGAFLFASAVEAALRVGQDNDLDASDIDYVTVRGHKFLEENNANRPLPAGSLAYYVASALVRRDFTWSHFAAGRGDGAAIDHLRDRVRIEPTTEHDAPGAWGWAAEVAVTARGGAVHRATVDLPPGSVVAGVTWDAIDAKAYDLLGTAGVTDDVIGRILGEVKRLDAAPDTAALTDLLR